MTTPGLRTSEELQRAIDQCAARGGGAVRIPPGTHVSGPLMLASHVNLHLDAGAVLQASPDPHDYPAHQRGERSDVFLRAAGARHVTLTGPGVIRGNGQGDFRGKDPRRGKLDPEPTFRVKLIQFVDCTDVRIRNVTLQESDSWTVHLRGCERVWIDGVAILNNVNRMNSDGIDPDSCRDVHISNCHIVAGDDCIVLKTTTPTPCANVVITNCTLETTCTALKLGTESRGEFRNIHVSNCVIHNSSSGIALHMKDGTVMERVTFSGISYHERADDPVRYCASPLLLDIERRHPDTPLGAIRDVTVRDFHAVARVGMLIQGLPASPIRGLSLQGIHLRVPAPWDFADRKKRIGGLRTAGDQQDTVHACKPSYLTLAHVDGLLVDDVTLDLEHEPVGPADAPPAALWLEHVAGAEVRRVRRSPHFDGLNLIVEGAS